MGYFKYASATYSLVIKWAYQYKILAGEVKNFAKVKFLSFSRTDVFLHMMKWCRKMMLLKQDCAVGVCAWLI